MFYKAFGILYLKVNFLYRIAWIRFQTVIDKKALSLKKKQKNWSKDFFIYFSDSLNRRIKCRKKNQEGKKIDGNENHSAQTKTPDLINIC